MINVAWLFVIILLIKYDFFVGLIVLLPCNKAAINVVAFLLIALDVSLMVYFVIKYLGVKKEASNCFVRIFDRY